MRVARVISYLKIGGVEKRLFYVLSYLKNTEQIEPYVVCIHSKGALCRLFEEEGIPVYLVRFNSRFDPKAIFKLVKLFKRLKIDIVHTHMYRPGVSGSLAAFIYGAKVIYNIHNLNHWDNKRQLITDRLFNFTRDSVVGVSRTVVYDYCIKTNFSPEKIEVVYNGIDPNEFLCGLKRSNTFVFSVISRLVPHKRVDKAIGFFRRLCKYFKNIELLVVGGGPERKRLEQVASNVGQVKFYGEVLNVKDILSSSSFLLLFSEKEGFSNAVLEAMASCCVPVVSDVGGNREAIHHKKCGLINDENKAVNLLVYPSVLKKIAINARKRVVNNFTLKHMSETTMKLYKEFTCDG